MLMLTVQKFAFLGQPKNIKQYPQKSHLKVGVISCISSPEQIDVELAHTSSQQHAWWAWFLCSFIPERLTYIGLNHTNYSAQNLFWGRDLEKTGEQLLVHMEAVV